MTPAEDATPAAGDIAPRIDGLSRGDVIGGPVGIHYGAGEIGEGEGSGHSYGARECFGILD
ncbi:MAG: hypothetical protein ACRD0S_06300, partial [Acidimicrobiales bacterium]